MLCLEGTLRGLSGSPFISPEGQEWVLSTSIHYTLLPKACLPGVTYKNITTGASCCFRDKGTEEPWATGAGRGGGADRLALGPLWVKKKGKERSGSPPGVSRYILMSDNIITAINKIITVIMLYDNRPLGLSKGFPCAGLSFSICSLGGIAPTPWMRKQRLREAVTCHRHPGLSAV